MKNIDSMLKDFLAKGGKIKKLNKSGYVHSDLTKPEDHRIIYEEAFGKLDKFIQVHHINGIRHDNRLENLVAIPKAFHEWLHSDFSYYETQRFYSITPNDILEVLIKYKSLKRGTKKNYTFTQLYRMIRGWE